MSGGDMVLMVPGLSLPLRPTDFGPLIASGDPRLAPLELIVNEAVSGNFSELAPALRRGAEQVGTAFYTVRRPDDGVELERALKTWHEQTGSTADSEELYVLSADFYSVTTVVPRRVLLQVLDELEQLRARAPRPLGPWLFCDPPIWHEAAPDEEAPLRELEEQAADLEVLESTAAADDVGTRPATSARRRSLFFGLEAAGLFVDAFGPQKQEALERWNCPVLASYNRAAGELHRYFRSAERRRHIPAATSEATLGSRVSIDWFRVRQSPPAPLAPFDWLGHCERTLRDSETGPGYTGDLFARVGDSWWRLGWRRDDGTTAALLKAELRP
jgi:hypothetical protein